MAWLTNGEPSRVESAASWEAGRRSEAEMSRGPASEVDRAQDAALETLWLDQMTGFGFLRRLWRQLCRRG